jgi:tetrapyrrole methylase family protein/MazG family protein
MKNSFEALLNIVKRLRHPVTGCPWDKVQTNETLVPNFIEELYECIEAIDNKDYQHLSEELGDLLLHIALQIEISKENKHFDEKEVFEKIITKLISRHPHIFAEKEVNSVHQVKKNWELIKMEEKKHRESVLEGIPKAMPSLIVAQRTQEKAAAVGFDWPDLEPIFDKLQEETDELHQAIANQDSDNIQEEIGDLLFTIVNLSRKLGFDADTALRISNEKFTERFKKLEKHYKENNQDLTQSDLTEMDTVWNKIKSQ